MKAFSFIVIFPSLLLPTTRAIAQEGKVESQSTARAHWSYLLSGWRAEREKLRTYELRVKGHEIRYGKHNLMIGKSDLLDPNARHEINLHILRGDGGFKKSVLHWGKFAQSAGTWIETPQYVAELPDTSAPVITLIKPTDKRQEFAFDLQPEAIGICGAEEFRFSNSGNPLDFVEKVFTQDFSFRSLTDLGQARYRVEVYGSNEGIFTHELIVVNEASGFTVEDRSYYRSKGLDGPAEPIDGEIHTTWIQRGDLWLPSTLSEIRRAGLSTVELTFDWISVNQPIPSQVFELDAMGAPKGTIIADQRLGREKTMVIGLTGGTEPVIPPPLPESWLRPSTVAILGIGAILIMVAVIAGWFVLRRGHVTLSDRRDRI